MEVWSPQSTEYSNEYQDYSIKMVKCSVVNLLLLTFVFFNYFVLLRSPSSVTS